MIQKLICALLLCAAQTNFCMEPEQPVAGNPPDDGQVWIEIKSSGDLYKYQFDGKRDREWNLGKLAAVSLNSHDIPNMPNMMCYACIRDSSIEVLRTNYFPISINYHNVIKQSSPTFIRGLTLPEMKEIMNGNVLYTLCKSFREEVAKNWRNAMEQVNELAKTNAAELEDMKQKYKTLRNLNPKAQRNYVLNNSCIVTLCAIRAKRKSPLSILPKDVLHDYILRPLIALETERISKMPLNLEQPKSEQPQ